MTTFSNPCVDKDVQATSQEVPTPKDTPSIEAIVLDFDGVILESNQIKAETLRRLFSQYPEHSEAIINLHQEHGGLPRHEKLRIICEEIVGLPIDEDGIQELSRECGRMVDEKMMACPFTPGAQEFLKTYSALCPLFIATGVPEDEMRSLIKRRGLGGYFTGVYGSPRGKAAILRDIMAENSWEPHGLVFIGDSIDDYNGALAAGVPFIGRAAPGLSNPFPAGKVGLTVASLAELHQIWQGVPVSPF